MPRKKLQIDFDCTDKLSKEQVGEFITKKMTLKTSTGEPKWSVGILTLVEHGMKRWDAEADIDPQTFEHELNVLYGEVQENKQAYRERLEEFQKENQRLRQELEDARSSSPSP